MAGNSIVPLSEMVPGQSADTFAILSAISEATTRKGDPYFRVTFRDDRREVSFPIWSNSPFAVDCRDHWQAGQFYKLRATYTEGEYGSQLELERIRPVVEEDRQDGFDEMLLLPHSRFDPDDQYRQLMEIVQSEIGDEALRQLVADLLEQYREPILKLPAATHNHHAYLGGYIEHVLSVTKTCLWLAGKYGEYYSDLDPPLSRDLLVAGGALHDIGKIRELERRPQGAVYSPAGVLIGHMLQGRDMLREAAAGRDLDEETLLRLEHIIISHQRLPEWGAPKPPMTPEALLVHYADDMDAKLQMMLGILATDKEPGSFTGRRNALGQRVFRGLEAE